MRSSRSGGGDGLPQAAALTPNAARAAVANSMRRLLTTGRALGTAPSCHCRYGTVCSLGSPRDCGSPVVHWRIVGPVGTIQHEELAVASDPQLRSARLPSQKQVIELLDGEFARAGYEIEDVVIDGDARPPRIMVIADGDEGLDLDSIAALSRSASELLDTVDSSKTGSPYVLEVTSPGVDRPLTEEKHYRRARGRKVEVTLSDGSQLTGRLGEARGGTVSLVVPEGGGAITPFANCLSAVSPKPLSRWSSHLQTSGSSSWPANRGRGQEHEYRHGGIARHRGRQGHLGRCRRGHHQVRVAHRLSPHRGARSRRPHRDRPQDRRRPGDGARDRRRRQHPQRMGRHPRGIRPHRGHDRTPGDLAAAARRREREELRRVLHPGGRDRRRCHPAGQPRQRPRPRRGPDGQRDQGLGGRHTVRRTGPQRDATNTATGCVVMSSVSAGAPANP